MNKKKIINSEYLTDIILTTLLFKLIKPPNATPYIKGFKDPQQSSPFKSLRKIKGNPKAVKILAASPPQSFYSNFEFVLIWSFACFGYKFELLFKYYKIQVFSSFPLNQILYL